MSLLPDSGWLRALDLKASTFAAVSLGCGAVSGLAEVELLHLGVLPAWVRAVFAIIGLLAALPFLGPDPTPPPAPTPADQPGNLRVSGSFGFLCRSGSLGVPDAPGATAPTLDARWEFYPISADVTTAI